MAEIKKEQGHALLHDATTLGSGVLLLLPDGASRRLRALPPTTWTARRSRLVAQPVLALRYDDPKLSRAACHHSTQAGREKRRAADANRARTAPLCSDSATVA